jgi:DNA-binding NtrC family response regulator
MKYMFLNHYRVSKENAVPQVAHGPDFPTVLLAESDPEMVAIYTRHLNKADLAVILCIEPTQLIRHVTEVRPHLLVLNPTYDPANSVMLLEQVTKHAPHLPIVTIGHAIPDPYLDRIMATGVSLHLNRSFSQPRDLVIAIRQILGLN